eukprot:gnl/MRDRNA2_/MRDRNA2_40684_c0_seq1.p1 gnl/MRDRNA2_/MRDRNA2_40684_c0~~gnl/MRDRNA2_/MRDRNA2_40684_c0_seq1.p1  ORF type:complete len:733 (-),score=141.78 gnl/MRDRNA2_/MRDRNA2_40684_c0_seq1:12-2210(-)
MDPRWVPVKDTEDDSAPPWVQHSRMQTQQEVCAQRFLRFASLRHAHAVIVLWSMAMWFAGVHPMLMSAPMVYFSGAIFLGHWYRRFRSVEGLSGAILTLNGLNAFHLAALCSFEGDKMLTSPMYAFVPLCRIVFGMFTQSVHLHLSFSTLQTLLTIMYNCDRVASDETLLVILVLLLLELTVVLALAEGPCGYEEAIMHLTHFRAQHQLVKSQAFQQVDLEREEFSGQLLAIATQSVAELTAAVENASQPVLDMLKASCATGTKSAREAEQIGLVGEDLKERVGQILRFKTQGAQRALQEKAKERCQQLQNRAVLQQESEKSVLSYLHQHVGQSLVRMYELELDSEASLEQFIQSEVNRAMETADSKMELVCQAAHAMDRRIADMVEVLLSILRYFRSKGLHVQALNVHMRPSKEPQARVHRRSTGALDGVVLQASKKLASINEKSGADAQEEELQATDTCEDSSRSAGSISPRSVVSTEGASTTADEGTSNATDAENAAASQAAPSEAVVPEVVASDAVTTEASASEAEGCSVKSTSCPPSPTGSRETDTKTQTSRGGSPVNEARTSSPTALPGKRGETQATTVPDATHPLFASRLSYRSEEFFWTWASSLDFRSEMDALRQWKRARARQKAQEEEVAAAAAVTAADQDETPTAVPDLQAPEAAAAEVDDPIVPPTTEAPSPKVVPPPKPKPTASKSVTRRVYIDLSTMQVPSRAARDGHAEAGESSGSEM